jgi:DUF4097 and DUF4098 domain-containing protein YvlB
MRFYATSAWLGLLALGSTACTIGIQGQGVVSHEEKRFTVTGDPDLNLRTFDGTIEVRSWDQKEVRVEIARRGVDAKAAAALVVNATQNGNRIVIEAPNPPKSDGLFIGASSSVSLIVTVPKRVTIEARTGDGSIAVDDLAGSIVLQSGDGAIKVTRLMGDLKVHTGDGSIRADEIAGKIEAVTGDGTIDVSGRLDAVSIRTGDGSVRVTAGDGSAVASDWSITTGDGSIDLQLPKGLDAELDAHTNDGHVRATGMDDVQRDERDDRHSVRGRFGKGGRTVKVRSGDGSIAISR